MTAREHAGDSKPSRLKLNMTPLSGRQPRRKHVIERANQMSETFQAATAPSAPIGVFTGKTDPLEWRLPEPASARMIALHQRASDLFATIPRHEDIMEYTDCQTLARAPDS